jgi:hypothetical protein
LLAFEDSTSSKPPSSDITKPKTSKKPGRRGKPKRGGQAGHQQHLRENLPPERVDETCDYEITDEDIQRLGLKPTDEFETYQFIELPESPVFVTEHRLRVYLTTDGERYVPDVGDILNKPIFGPRLLAMIGWMKSAAHCRYSTIETYMEDVLQVPVSRETMTVEGFRRSMMIHRDRFLELARNPPSSKEALNLAARFAIRECVVEGSDEVPSYDMSQDYFRFMFADGVEPTNNHNEQQIRQCVIDRMRVRSAYCAVRRERIGVYEKRRLP